jgi:hypothetical protein
MDHLLRRGLRDAVEGLDGDLQAIDKTDAFAAVDAAVGHRAHDLHEGMLDAAGVFDGGETDGPFVFAETVPGIVVELVVEVAVRPVPQGGRFALGAARHDVTTFDEHGGLSLTPSPLFWGKYLILWGLRISITYRNPFNMNGLWLNISAG